MTNFLNKVLFAGFAMTAIPASAQAAFVFSNGDLILGFQATDNLGEDKNVFFNLGSATDYRDGNIAPSTLGNIAGTLSSVYGANWYDRTDLRFGVIGNFNDFDPGGFLPPGPVNGDPSATLYVSQPALFAGQGAILTFQAASELAYGGTRVSGLEVTIAGLTDNPDGSATLTQGTSQWNTGWTAYNPASPNPSFAIFSNIEQTFGQSGDSTYIDLQRILSTSNGEGVVPGPVLQGEYITSFAIGRDGSISVVPEPSVGLLAAFAGLAAATRRRRNAAA